MYYIVNILQPYREPRKFITAKMALGVSERKLLALSFGVAICSFIGNSINATFLNDSTGSREEISRLISSYFAVALFFVPIFLYLMSGIFHGILWIFYRIKFMSLSRLTLFWALFLCMPFQLILSMLTNIIGNEYASNFLNLCMLLYFIFLWTIFNCEIFKMNKVFEIFILKIFLVVTSFALMTLL
ncbi:MAG: hypothetical protein ACJ0BS_07110 [Paracoccaceae bacterium]